jgi:hypothetical protein
MREPEPGVTFRLRLAGGRIAVHAAAQLRDARRLADPTVRFELYGDLSAPGIGERVAIRSGMLEVDRKPGGVRVRMAVGGCFVAGELDASSRPPVLRLAVYAGPDANGDLVGAAELPLGGDVLARLLATLHATDTDPVAAKLKADAATAKLLLRAVRRRAGP